eukprot:3337941-Pleurochrysis_carterae.AAC.1
MAVGQRGGAWVAGEGAGGSVQLQHLHYAGEWCKSPGEQVLVSHMHNFNNMTSYDKLIIDLHPMQNCHIPTNHGCLYEVDTRTEDERM